MSAILTARRPTTLSVASMTNQPCSTVSRLDINVGIGAIFLPGGWRESIMIRGRGGTSRAAALNWMGLDEVGAFSMKTVIRLSRKEELKDLPILLRHFPGMMLRNRLFVL